MYRDLSSRSSPPCSIVDVAAKWNIPRETLRRRWKQYQRSLKDGDRVGLLTALGDLDGRRDNHRILTRDEEAEVMAQIDKENVNPNKPEVSRIIRQVHQRHIDSSLPEHNTRSSPPSQQSLTASSSTVTRFKRDHHLVSRQVKVEKVYVRTNGVPSDEEREQAASCFLERVHESILRNGARHTINADEVPYYLIAPPSTLWAHSNGPPPSLLSSSNKKQRFTAILATSAAGHKLTPAFLVGGKTKRTLTKFAHLSQRAVFYQGARRTNQLHWRAYIQDVIEPWCAGKPGTFVVDSHKAHLADLPVDEAMEHDIYTVQVPESMTSSLQPNDVGVYGVLKAIDKGMFLEQTRRETSHHHDIVQAIERCLDAWERVSRDAVRAAWVEANPLLRGLSNEKGSMDEWSDSR